MKNTHQFVSQESQWLMCYVHKTFVDIYHAFSGHRDDTDHMKTRKQKSSEKRQNNSIYFQGV